MQQIIKISLFLVGLASTSAIAAEHQHLNHETTQATTMEAGRAIQWSDGVVKKVDQKAGRITLKHSAIAGLMPAMTMSYRMVPAESLKSMQTADKVRFVLKKDNEAYVVTRIEVVR